MFASMRKLVIASGEEDNTDAAEGPAFAETGLMGDEVPDALPLVQTGQGVGPALALPLLGVTAGKGAGVATDAACEALGDSAFASAAAALATVSLANMR